MHTQPHFRRQVSGLLLLNKPAGYSSNQALQRIKQLYRAAKAGHTGSLDPFATGLLPICMGEATKFSHFLLDADKVYRATLKLGITTTTGDIEGEVVRKQPVNLTFDAVQEVVHAFRGHISQIPPMHSAIKHQGRPLYEYARQGLEVVRQPRMVYIHAITLLALKKDIAAIEVKCSKGTYIRVLAEDIGRVLGCGAHLIALERLSAAGFSLQDAYTLEQLVEMTETQRDRCLLPTDTLLQQFPEVELDEECSVYFRQGQPIWKSGIRIVGFVRVYKTGREFLGLGEVLDDGRVAPRRLVVN